MEDAKNRRRNYYIKKEFQRNFIIKFCTLVVIGAIISGVIIYLMSRSTVTTTFENSKLIIKSTADFILPSVLLSSIVVVVIVGLATIIITLFTSHRIAGPLYAIERDIDKLISGDLNVRFVLRQLDEIKPIATKLDTMAQGFKERIVALKSLVNELESAAGSVNTKEINDKVRRLKEILEKFRT